MYRIGAIQATSLGILDGIGSDWVSASSLMAPAKPPPSEIGIRMALSSEPTTSRILVLGQGVRP